MLFENHTKNNSLNTSVVRDIIQNINSSQNICKTSY